MYSFNKNTKRRYVKHLNLSFYTYNSYNIEYIIFCEMLLFNIKYYIIC